MPIVNGLEEEFAGRVALQRLDANDSANVPLQATYEVRGHPSFVVLDESGEVMKRFLGPQDEATLRTAMQAVAE